LNNSPHAQRELGKFTEPDSFFHFSLIASLFWFIDTKHKHLFRKPFDDFEGVIEELLHTTGIENAAALLGTAVNIVTEIASTVRNLTNLENESTEKEILRQQLLLIQFEDIRLRTLLAIEYQYTMRGKRAVPLKGPNARVKNRPLYIKLYGELCRIKDDRALMLRPLSVLLFWKYLLAKEFDPATARLNLMDAAEELKLDPCVPRYSVYRVLIPRHLAMILSEEAITTFETVDAAVAGGPIKMPGLAKEIQSKLIDALRYALDAFNVTVEEVDPRRGDLLFSPKRLDDALKDAAQVIKIYLFYVTKFREAITVRAGSIRLNNLVEVVNHVRQETLVRFLPESEQEAFYFNLAAVESSLDREQQPKTMGDSNAT